MYCFETLKPRNRLTIAANSFTGNFKNREIWSLFNDCIFIQYVDEISRRIVRASDCQCQSRNSPGFDPDTLKSEGRQM